MGKGTLFVTNSSFFGSGKKSALDIIPCKVVPKGRAIVA